MATHNITIPDNKPSPILSSPQNEEYYGLKIFQSSLVSIANILIGVVVGISILFAFRNGLPLGSTPMHVVLCVIGYQLLMAQGILGLVTNGSFASRFTLVDKRRAHWILQILGSGLAIGGSIHKSLDKDVNWNTLHGRFALVAMVFTSVSLVNGLASLYAYELRNVLPGNLSKITHICFGTVAFVASSISLCYGFDKSSFRNWATQEMTSTIIAFTAIFTFITIINPLITMYNKSLSVINRN